MHSDHLQYLMYLLLKHVAWTAVATPFCKAARSSSSVLSIAWVKRWNCCCSTGTRNISFTWKQLKTWRTSMNIKQQYPKTIKNTSKDTVHFLYMAEQSPLLVQGLETWWYAIGTCNFFRTSFSPQGLFFQTPGPKVPCSLHIAALWSGSCPTWHHRG